MYDVIHIYKGSCMMSVTVQSEKDHYIYLSAYGTLASELLEKYAEDQREDNEEIFAEWDKSMQEAMVKTGFSAYHKTEDGHIYINTYQDGVGISPEDRIRIQSIS
ncbi:hypothetical protein GF312_17895 [Candidatus Poribacteria bacterium]|nr:hypothetical protein [Candidatus Poribacteria bacterium]